MTRTLYLTRQQLIDVVALCSGPIGTIERCQAALDQLPGPCARASIVHKIVAAAVEDKNSAARLVELGLRLASFAWRTRQSAGDIDVELRRCIARSEDYQKIDVSRTHVMAIAEFSQNASIFASAKAIDLSYDHEKILTSARVITDIRPVLDKPKGNPVGAIISHSLRIEFFDAERSSADLAVSVDEDDLRDIIAACEEALKKKDASRKLISGVDANNIFMAGDEQYGAD